MSGRVSCMEVRGLQGRAKGANGSYMQTAGQTQHRRPVYVQQLQSPAGMCGDDATHLDPILGQSYASRLYAVEGFVAVVHSPAIDTG